VPAVLPQLTRKIIALLPFHESLTLGQVVELTSVSPGMPKLRLRKLVASGHLLPKGQGPGGYYLRARRPKGGGRKNVFWLSQPVASSTLASPNTGFSGLFSLMTPFIS
jgi:hypothetical protein